MRLGETDVARIGLGTNRLTHTRENIEFIKAAVAAGVQVIDTAHLYTGGQSEETIGAALAPVPDNVVVAVGTGEVATPISPPVGPESIVPSGVALDAGSTPPLDCMIRTGARTPISWIPRRSERR